MVTGPLLPRAFSLNETARPSPVLLSKWLRGENLTDVSDAPKNDAPRRGAVVPKEAQSALVSEEASTVDGVVFVCLGRMPHVEPRDSPRAAFPTHRNPVVRFVNRLEQLRYTFQASDSGTHR